MKERKMVEVMGDNNPDLASGKKDLKDIRVAFTSGRTG